MPLFYKSITIKIIPLAVPSLNGKSLQPERFMSNKIIYKRVDAFQTWSRIAIAFTVTVCLARIFEYIAVASKFFIANAYQYELAGLLYDVWACLVYSCLLLLPFLLLHFINKRFAAFIFHFVNVFFIIMYLALLVVFSERTRPFDHEFFTRNAADSWLTTKQMLAGGVQTIHPFHYLYHFIFCTVLPGV